MKLLTKFLSFISLSFLLGSCSKTNSNLYFGLTKEKLNDLIGIKDNETSLDDNKGESYKITYGVKHIYGFFKSSLYNHVTVYDLDYESNDEFPRPSYQDYEEVTFFNDITFITSPSVNPVPKVNADGLVLSLKEATSEGILLKENIKQISTLFNIYYQDYYDDYLVNKNKAPSLNIDLNYGLLSRPNLDNIIKIYDKEFKVKEENTLFINYYGTHNSYLLVELYNNESSSSYEDLKLNRSDFISYNVSTYNFKFNDEFREIYGYNLENNEIKNLESLYKDNIINESSLSLINNIHRSFYNY